MKLKKEKGITLIALVVTIIILIILAGVSINLLFGQYGIITRAKNAKDSYAEESIKERISIMIADYEVEKNITNKSLLEYLQEQVSAGNLEDVTDNEDGTYTIELDGYEIILNSSNGQIIDIGKLGGIKPEITLTKNTEEEKQEEVIIHVKVATSEGTILSVTKPDGSTTTDLEFEYPVTENKTYTFKAEGSNGRKTVVSIDITNIKEPITYTVAFTGTNVTSNGESTIKEAETYTTTLTIENGYKIETITVKMGGTELVKNTGYTYANSTITIPNVNGNIEIAVSVKWAVITGTNIETDASYIGKYVNYGGQETYKGVKWRIFNAENGKIQLIADNYIKSDVMPQATNIRRGTAEYSSMYSDYCVNSSDNRITLLNYINTASNWSEFVAVTGATVIGSPTIEQFKNSYNRTHEAASEASIKEIFISQTETEMTDNLKGYYVGTSENPTSTYIDGLNTTEMENLYVINDNTNANAYRLGSPSVAINDGVMGVACNGRVGSGYYGRDDFALRPLVLLPSGITLVEQENGTYNIQ